MNNSYFDGTVAQDIGYSILTFIITVFSFGIATPWAVCMYHNWQIGHTVIDGKRLYFDGTGGQLFGQWIKWLLLIFITFGIYSFWVNVKMQQWLTKHTHTVATLEQN